MTTRFELSWALLLLSLACSTGQEPSEAGTGATGDTSGGASALGGSAATSGAANASGGGNAPGDLHTPSFSCDPEAVPPSLPLRRLSAVQLKNTLKDLITDFMPKSASSVLSEVGAEVDRLPADSRQGPDHLFARFDRLDQTVQQRLVDDEYALARQLGGALTQTSARLSELVGACATKESDRACLDGFIRRFGERVQRRELEPEDVAFYRRAAGSAPFAPSGYADVVAVLLASPYFLYQVEHGQETSDERAELSGAELASRLAYQFWQTAPDAELLEAARSGELLTDEGYEAQLERVLGDAKVERGFGELIAQWLDNPKLEELDARVAEPVYAAFLDGFEPASTLKQRMQREVTDSALYYLQNGGSFADFFASDRSFAKTDDLAELYQTPVWSAGEPPKFTQPERAGLLTRAALLATGLSETRPIIKGVLIRKAILCDPVPPPPADVANSPPPVSDALASTRQAVHAKTSTGSCAACHVTLINDLGFATENFDALGRLRSEQPLFDAKGKRVGTASVDTSSTPQVELGDRTPSSGAADLTQQILASDKPYACFARQYFRFTFARVETEADGCALSALKSKLRDNAGLYDVLKTLALDRSFKERTF